MGKLEKIILAIIALLVVLLITIVLLVINLNQASQKKGATDEQTIMNTYKPIEELEVQQDIRLVDSYSQYYSIWECIKQYYTNIGKKKQQEVYQVLDSQYIQQNSITVSNVLEKVTKINSQEPDYHIKQMHIQESDRVSLYYISGYLKENAKSQQYRVTYFIVYLDNYNATYAIEPIAKAKYDGLVQKGQEVGNKEVTSNENNQYQVITINSGTIVTKLLEDYQYKIQNNIEEAYVALEQNYKNKKFSDIQEYKQYVTNSGIKKAQLTKYQKSSGQGYTQYIGIDTDGNYYIFRETAVMNYSLILDTYTIDLPEFVNKYNEASEQKKVGMNIQRVFDAINDGDYRYVYNKLDHTFRTNNFKTEAEFEKYIKGTFYFKNKVVHNNCKQSGNVYVYDIAIVDESNKDKRQVNKTIIMQLKEGTDFVMSFNVK